MEGHEMLRVIVYQDSGQWVAQCLEYDICAHAPDEDQLRERFGALLQFEHNLSIERNGAAFSGIPAAPEEFQAMWEKAIASDPIETATGPIELKKCA